MSQMFCLRDLRDEVRSLAVGRADHDRHRLGADHVDAEARRQLIGATVDDELVARHEPGDRQLNVGARPDMDRLGDSLGEGWPRQRQEPGQHKEEDETTCEFEQATTLNQPSTWPTLSMGGG